MDVLALAQAGFTSATATLGTSATAQHLEQLFRTAPRVVFCFDGDAAGRKAAWRALETSLPLLREGRQASFVFLPEGEDPDTWVRRAGADRFRAEIDGGLPLSTFLFDQLIARVDLGTLDGRARLVELARPLVNRIPSDVYRELLITQLAEVIRMPAGRLGELLASGTPASGPARAESQPNRPARIVAPPVAGRGNLVRQAISLLVHFPGAGAGIPLSEALERVDRPGVPLLIELLAQLREDPAANTATLLERWRTRPEYGPLSKLAVGECLVPDETAATAEIRSALDRLVAEHYLARLQALQEKAGMEPLTAEEKAELQGLLREKAQSARPAGAK